jgi:hypothetical protein
VRERCALREALRLLSGVGLVSLSVCLASPSRRSHRGPGPWGPLEFGTRPALLVCYCWLPAGALSPWADSLSRCRLALEVRVFFLGI